MSNTPDKALSDLKAGDEVAIRAGMSSSYYIYTIASIDKRGIIMLEDGSRYRANGSPMEKGSKWNYPDPIEPVTDEIRQSIRKTTLVNRMAGLERNHWKAMSIATLEAVAAIVWKDEG